VQNEEREKEIFMKRTTMLLAVFLLGVSLAYAETAQDYIHRGIGYHDAGDYANAIASYDLAIQVDPSNAVAYYGRGTVYFTQGNIPEALNDFNQAIAIDPNDPRSLYARGKCYKLQGNLAQATADYNLSMQIDPAGIGPYENYTA
jgi:Tfp pilus assembly protein PilF